MKKITSSFFFFIIASIFLSFAFYFAYSWVNPTSSPPSGGGVLQTDSSGLKIVTSTYFISGNVGIGTTNPNNLIQVYDLIQFNNTNFSTLLGYQAGKYLLGDGLANTAIGYQALYTATSSDFNTAIGYGALHSNTTGSFNTAIGFNSLSSNTTGNDNTAVGLVSLSSNTTGNANTAVGRGSLSGNTTGGYNTAIGFDAGRYTSNGRANSTSTNSVYIGYNTRALASGDTNEIVIGANTTGFGSNTATYGNNQITKHIFQAGNVSIGTTTPSYRLHVAISATGDVAGFTNSNGTCTINPDVPGLNCTSDINKKKDINPLSNSLEKVMALNPVSYRWINQEDNTRRYGFIAQEVEKVIPEIVTTHSDGLKSLSITGLIPFLTGAIKEQQKQIEELKVENNYLKEKIKALEEKLGK